MSSAPLKNIIIAGVTGSVGAPILRALPDEPSLTIIILTRASSSAKFPSHIPVKKVSDAFTLEELTAAFTAQDAVIVALSTTPITIDDIAFRLIDAAVAAGVKRFIPSEFGTNNLDLRARKLVLRKAKESEGGLTWTSFSCAFNPAKSGNFLGIDVKGRKATIWDSGKSKFTVTTSSNTGLAVVHALLSPAESANKQVFLSDFVTSSWEIWAIEEKASKPVMKEPRKKFDEGDYNAVYILLALSFVGDVNVGYDFEKEQLVWNQKLGLPKVALDEVVKEAIELVKSS
ncbi:NAD(P)-binding protein [Zopfia rhizophila CBS 207.26]|uniref:NAD(P)-binding protein n=1 Tax=Zopfia rhizophila CBS 207.26 TaxID=1314779 RepID=A0A6A6E6H8_9PEZI|nr:NAD(P)-binding protein [Zopfia rhizophila CBS 207.26]